MQLDTLREKLKELTPGIDLIRASWKQARHEQEFEKLNQIVHSENFWQHDDRVLLTKQYQRVKELRDKYLHMERSFDDLKELIELFSEDDEQLNQLSVDLNKLGRLVASFKLTLLLGEEDDTHNCFLNINAGAGGTESQDWAAMLLRMYLRFCEQEGFSCSILDYQSGEEAGIKSATLYVKAANAYGILKSESGIHRLVRISPFDANKRRHTSFSSSWKPFIE